MVIFKPLLYRNFGTGLGILNSGFSQSVKLSVKSSLCLSQALVSSTCALGPAWFQEPFWPGKGVFPPHQPSMCWAWIGHGLLSPLSRVANPQACHSSEGQLFSPLYYTEDSITYRSKIWALESDRVGIPLLLPASCVTLARLLNHFMLQFPSLCNGDTISVYLIGVSWEWK